MLVCFGLLLAFQGPPAVQDTTDTAAHAPPRTVATPALVASAYEDPGARALVARARAARLGQDSSLIAYDAMAKRRLTVRFGLGESGRERLLLRSEGASRVRWRAGVGARIDVVAARTAIPLAYPGVRVLSDMLDDNPVPYFPGREGLVGFSDVVRSRDRHRSPMIHPLEAGAEAFYRYAIGDSVSLRFPDGRRIQLRELRVIPRAPRFDVIVGSLWIDTRSGQLVRAGYRPAAAMDIARVARDDDPHAFDDVPMLVKPLIFPMSATVSAFIVEYGLVDERWWMPRIQTVEGRARIGPVRASFSVEQTFQYASVNGPDSLAPIVVLSMTDSSRRARRDSIRAARRSGDDTGVFSCPAGDTIVRRHLRHEGALPVEIRIPCDTVVLAHSPELPPSIFDAGDETFGVADRDQVLRSLGLSTQPMWSPAPPTIHYGLTDGLLRYNRIEGLSAGVRVDQLFGAGYAGNVVARLGTADWQPGIEARVQRSDGVRTLGVAAYRRLVPVDDWGDPLSLGSSLGALVLGNDNAFYYRSWGVELTGRRVRAAALDWRVFAEQERNADVNTTFAMTRMFGAHDVRANIRAARAGEVGATLGLRDTWGLDPRGWRLDAGVRFEGATGTFDYARGAVDATASRGIGPRLEAVVAAAVGSSVGTLPPQRLWYLGGAQTVRGQIAGQDAGNAYWFSRMSLAYGAVAIRPTLFFDAGWAGSRSDWSAPGGPLTGAGAGVAFLDGVLHFDLARGLHPARGWRGMFYVDARF